MLEQVVRQRDFSVSVVRERVVLRKSLEQNCSTKIS
jgi:hypothetical protein